MSNGVRGMGSWSAGFSSEPGNSFTCCFSAPFRNDSIFCVEIFRGSRYFIWRKKWKVARLTCSVFSFHPPKCTCFSAKMTLAKLEATLAHWREQTDWLEPILRLRSNSRRWSWKLGCPVGSGAAFSYCSQNKGICPILQDGRMSVEVHQQPS